MLTKVMGFCILMSNITFAQVENFNTSGKFKFIDTLSVPAQYTVNPGQLSKNGEYYNLGLYYDTDDTTYSNLFSINMKKKVSPLSFNLIPPAGYQEFFQCSETFNKKTIVFVVNNFKGWGGNDIAIAERDESGNYIPRVLDEINSADVADAYPWISGDGLRIYFVKEQTIYIAERKTATEKFNTPLPLKFEGDVQTPVLSIWLSNDEKKLFYISQNIIYTATRKSMNETFSLPSVFTNEFKDFEFISSLSFTQKMKDLYLYYAGETTKILHYKLK